jgi:hypothetical protein
VWWRGRRGPRPPQPLPLRRRARRATPPACCHPPPTHARRITLVHSQQRLPAQPLLYLPFLRTLFCDSPVQPPLLRATPPVVYLGQFSSAVRSCSSPPGGDWPYTPRPTLLVFVGPRWAPSSLRCPAPECVYKIDFPPSPPLTAGIALPALSCLTSSCKLDIRQRISKQCCPPAGKAALSRHAVARRRPQPPTQTACAAFVDHRGHLCCILLRLTRAPAMQAVCSTSGRTVSCFTERRPARARPQSQQTRSSRSRLQAAAGDGPWQPAPTPPPVDPFAEKTVYKDNIFDRAMLWYFSSVMSKQLDSERGHREGS